MEDYRTFWTNVSSIAVLVMPSDNDVDNEKIEEADNSRDVIDDYMSDYNQVNGEYDEDMIVGESRTSGYNAGAVTVLPILDNSDKKDQPDSEHETESIDLSEHDTTLLPPHQTFLWSSNRQSDEDTTIRHRQSILITAPLRPRKQSSVPSTTASTTTSRPRSSSTTITTASTTTTTTLRTSSVTTAIASTTKNTSFMTSVPGGVMINARKKQTPRPRLMHPKFVFTTERSSLKTTITTSELDFTTILTTTTSTSTTTTTLTTTTTTLPSTSIKINTENNDSIYSHHFNLSEDSINILNADGEELEEKNKTLYKTETTSPPTFHDLPLLNNTLNNIDDEIKKINDSVPKLRSDLYDVMTNENATEVIMIGQVTELERMPRGNDEIEPLDDAYKRLEAQYGGWQNNEGSEPGGSGIILVIYVVHVCAYML